MRLRASIPLVRAGLAEVFPDIRGTVEPMPSVMQALLPSGVGAITLGSRVFVRPDLFDAVAAGDEPKLLAHEMIHVRQWRALGAIGFLAPYLTDYVRLRLIGCDHDTAYRHIRFEWSAYSSADRIVPTR